MKRNICSFTIIAILASWFCNTYADSKQPSQNNRPEKHVADDRTGVSDTLGIYLIPEYTLYPTSANEATFLLLNRSGFNIKCGAAYNVTYEDEYGVWRQLPMNAAFVSIDNVRPHSQRTITANLYPNLHHNKAGRYRMFYTVTIGPIKDIMMMTEFRLSDNEEELKNISKSELPIKSHTDEGDIYDIVEQMPSFPGGKEAMTKYLTDKIREMTPVIGCGGSPSRIIISFIVTEDGSIIKPQIIRSIDPPTDKVAAQIVCEMPKWIPGRHNGEPVKVRYTVPVPVHP